MIHINFTIRNPWSKRFNVIRTFSGKTPWQYKFWEFEILKTSDILSLICNLTTRESHSGLEFSLSLFGYETRFVFYDCRHWNYGAERYEYIDD